MQQQLCRGRMSRAVFPFVFLHFCHQHIVVGGRVVSASLPCRSVAFQFCTLVLFCCLPNHSNIFCVHAVEGILVSACLPCRSVPFIFQSRLFFLFSHVSPRPSFSFSFRLGCVHGRNFSQFWKTGGTPDIFSHEDSSDLPPPPPRTDHHHPFLFDRNRH